MRLHRQPLACLLLAGLLSTSTTRAAEPMIIPVYDQQRPPLVIIENSKFSGIYIDLFSEILTGAGIEFTFIPIPKQRARIMFERGEAMLSCCDNPAWRTRDDELKVQLFSDAMHYTHDLYVFPRGKVFDTEDLNALRTRHIVLVRGYGYRASEYFGTRFDLESESKILEFLSLGRADVAIINEDVLHNWMLAHPDTVVAGKCHDNASLHIRVHRQRSDLLEPINQSIKRLIKSGKREDILKKYLGPETDTKSPCRSG